MSSADSALIDKLRFPLAVMVVFIHVGNKEFTDGGEWFRVLFAQVIPSVAVPLFFLISGYLFYQGLYVWNWRVWLEKMRRRIHSLLIPYVLWIGLYVIYAYLHQSRLNGGWLPMGTWFSGNGGWSMWWDCIVTMETGPVGLPILSAHPYHRVLWFVRDLMIINLISPLMHLCIRKCRGWIVLFLFALYVLKIWPPIHSLGVTCAFFYTWGGWLSLESQSIGEWFGMWRMPSFVLSAVVLAPVVLFWRAPGFAVLKPIWTIVWGTAFLNLIGSCKAGGQLADCTFFLYVTHSVVLSNIRQALTVIPPWRMSSPSIFVMTGILTILFCVLSYYLIMKRYFPRATAFVCGK